MYFVVKSVRGYSDVTTFGPFATLADAQQSVTEGVNRGDDGDETQYTFFQYNSYVNKWSENNIEEVGHVLLRDEAEYDESERREESFR